MDSACSHRGELLGYVIVCLVSVRDLQNDVPCAAVREKKSKTAGHSLCDFDERSARFHSMLPAWREIRSVNAKQSTTGTSGRKMYLLLFTNDAVPCRRVCVYGAPENAHLSYLSVSTRRTALPLPLSVTWIKPSDESLNT